MNNPKIPEKLTNGLNTEQKKAVTQTQGPCLIVAGPGSGKTTVLTRRVAALYYSGTAPASILAVTFTNKAAEEMRNRLEKLVGKENSSRMWIATFHSAGARMIRYHHKLLDIRGNFNIADTDDVKKILKSIIESKNIEKLDAGELKELVTSAQDQISRQKNSMGTPEQLALQDELLGEIWLEYNKRMKAMNMLDFDDLLLKTAELTKIKEFQTWVQQKFDYILVDEYQDTNPVQEKIAHSIASHSKNICVVGDPDQAIYAFRGATPKVMETFTKKYPEAIVIRLGQNYRSTGNICAVGNALIEPNNAKYRALIKTQQEPGEKIELYCAKTGEDEAYHVVKTIQKIGGSLKEHAILMRVNAISRSFESELTRNGIPYEVVGGLKFLDRYEIKHALSWVKLVANPNDLNSFERSLSSVKRGLGEVAVASARQYVEQHPEKTYLDAAKDLANGTSRTAKSWATFNQDIEHIQSAKIGGLAALVKSAITKTGLKEAVAKMSQKESSDLDRSANLDELVNLASEFTLQEIPDEYTGKEGTIKVNELTVDQQLQAFVQYTALENSNDKKTETDKVSIMTIHAAKGREYDNVYCVGWEEDILPHKRSIDAAPGSGALEEERRLAFVAATRARKHLTISYTEERMHYGNVNYPMPSRFIQNLPEDAIERVESNHIPQNRNPYGNKPSNTKRFQGPNGSGMYTPPKSYPQRTQNTNFRGVKQNKVKPRKPQDRLDVRKLKVGVKVSSEIHGIGTVESFDGKLVKVRFGETLRTFDAIGARFKIIEE